MKLVSKSALMDSVIHHGHRECFEHSEMGIYDITSMREWASTNLEPYVVGLHQITPFLRASRVTENARIDDLPLESWLNDPGLFIILRRPEGETHLMIDGHHRALRREREGKTEMLFYMFEEKDAKRPSLNWHQRPDMEWGDGLVDGKIVKRT